MTRRPHGRPVRERIRARLIILASRERDHVCGGRLERERALADAPPFEAPLVVVLHQVSLSVREKAHVRRLRRAHDIGQVYGDEECEHED